MRQQVPGQRKTTSSQQRQGPEIGLGSRETISGDGSRDISSSVLCLVAINHSGLSGGWEERTKLR